jgi:hypothetical protein
MRKGQEEAPIELLIGVTILTFVLIIGFYTYQSLCSSQFEQVLKASFSKLSRGIELVYLGSVGTSQISQVDFSVPGACGGNVQSIRLLAGHPSTCQAQTGKNNCLQLIAVTQATTTQAGILVSEVIDVPETVTVINNLDTSCKTPLNLIDYSDNWDENKYQACWFRLQAYTIRITKQDQDEITLGPVI